MLGIIVSEKCEKNNLVFVPILEIIHTLSYTCADRHSQQIYQLTHMHLKPT